MIYIAKETVKGDLPADLFEAIEWWRMGWYARESILAQQHGARSAIFNSSLARDEDGPLIDLDVKPFDSEGFTLIRFQGQDLLRLHVSRLLKGAPLELEPFPPDAP